MPVCQPCPVTAKLHAILLDVPQPEKVAVARGCLAGAAQAAARAVCNDLQ